MPAAAVIPAPIAYIKIVAVKKLVVGFLLTSCGHPNGLNAVSVSILCSWAGHLTVICLVTEPLL